MPMLLCDCQSFIKESYLLTYLSVFLLFFSFHLFCLIHVID